MVRLLHVLTMLAVLWCGLHLSAAEADVPLRLDGAEWVIHAENEADHPADREAPHAAHACHSHCPVAPDPGAGPDVSGPLSIRIAPIAAPARELASLSQAPPVQPPAA